MNKMVHVAKMAYVFVGKRHNACKQYDTKIQ